MSEKHLPYIGGNFDRIVFKGDGSTWVREQSGTRYSDLFGTPERAARTFMETCAACKLDNCGRCGLDELMNHVDSYDALLEWLNQEVNI